MNELHELVGPRGARQWIEQHRVDPAENRGVGADAEREHQDRDRGKARIAGERAHRVAQVLQIVCIGESPGGAFGLRRRSRMASKMALAAAANTSARRRGRARAVR